MIDVWKKFSDRFPYEWDTIMGMTNTRREERIDITKYPKLWILRSMESDYIGEIFISRRSSSI